MCTIHVIYWKNINRFPDDENYSPRTANAFVIVRARNLSLTTSCAVILVL